MSTPEGQLSSRKPKSNALLICERVIREAETGQISLIGIFEAASVAEVPLVMPSLFVYGKMTDALGQYIFKLELVRRDDELVLGEAVLPPAVFTDPMGHNEVIFQIHGARFEQAGFYDFRLWANDMFVESKAFEVRRVV
jgi:hypothetical protein